MSWPMSEDRLPSQGSWPPSSQPSSAHFVGSIGTVAVEEWLRARRETRERREAFVRRYLFQLQDAVEALWYRVHNIRYEGGTGAMTPEYQQTTTVYALGRVLAVERVLTLEGVYPQLKKLHPKLGETLQDRPLSRKLRLRTSSDTTASPSPRRSSSGTKAAIARVPILRFRAGMSTGRPERQAGSGGRGPRSENSLTTRKGWTAGSTCLEGLRTRHPPRRRSRLQSPRRTRTPTSRRSGRDQQAVAELTAWLQNFQCVRSRSGPRADAAPCRKDRDVVKHGNEHAALARPRLTELVL